MPFEGQLSDILRPIGGSGDGSTSFSPTKATGDSLTGLGNAVKRTSLAPDEDDRTEDDGDSTDTSAELRR